MKVFFLVILLQILGCRVRSDSAVAQVSTLPRPDVSEGAPTLCAQMRSHPDLQVFYQCQFDGHVTSSRGINALNDFSVFVRWGGPNTALGLDDETSGILLSADLLAGGSESVSVEVIYRDVPNLGPVVGPNVFLSDRNCPKSLSKDVSFDASRHTSATLGNYEGRIRQLMAEAGLAVERVDGIFQDPTLQAHDRALTRVSGAVGLSCSIADICGEQSDRSCVGLFEGSVCATEEVTDGICLAPLRQPSCGCRPLSPGIRVPRS